MSPFVIVVFLFLFSLILGLLAVAADAMAPKLAISSVIGVILCVVLLWPVGTTQTEKVEIISLDDATTSSFVLGTGGSKQTYFAYKKSGKGYKRVHLSGASTIEEGYTDPHYIYECSLHGPFRFEVCNPAKTIIRVPEGTIIREVSLDNKD